MCVRLSVFPSVCADCVDATPLNRQLGSLWDLAIVCRSSKSAHSRALFSRRTFALRRNLPLRRDLSCFKKVSNYYGLWTSCIKFNYTSKSMIKIGWGVFFLVNRLPFAFWLYISDFILNIRNYFIVFQAEFTYLASVTVFGFVFTFTFLIQNYEVSLSKKSLGFTFIRTLIGKFTIS